jgi:transcriptional regulator with XRE-family HTH domain
LGYNKEEAECFGGYMSIIGENIKKYRTANNLTQKDLADHLHITPSTLSRWENGSRMPSSEDIDNISAFFSVPRSAICPEDTIVIKKSHLKIFLLSFVIVFLIIVGICTYKYFKEDRYTLIAKESCPDFYGDSALLHHYILPSNYSYESFVSFCAKLQKQVEHSDDTEYGSYVFYFYKNKEDYPDNYELYYMARRVSGKTLISRKQ